MFVINIYEIGPLIIKAFQSDGGILGVEVMMDIHKISQTFDQFLSIKACIPPEEVAIATKAREIHVSLFVEKFCPMQQKRIPIDKYYNAPPYRVTLNLQNIINAIRI